MQLYWMSLLIQDRENSKPWLCAMTDGELSLDNALKSIETGRKNYRVLSAWVDTFDEDNKKTTVYHECFVDVLGNVESAK